MPSQNIFLFIYNVEFDIMNIIKDIRRKNRELEIIEFIEEFKLSFEEQKIIEDYKKYLVLASTKYYIDNRKSKGFDQKDFIFIHLNNLYNIYNANYDDFENYSLITDPDITSSKYNRLLNRNLLNQFNNFESNDTDDLFDNIPYFKN